jgi:SAM-dependent methyltransferase
MAKVEDHHWWFIVRREIIADRIKTLRLPPHPKILEAGCGSGGNLKMLAAFGDLSAFELDDAARQEATDRGVGRVEAGSLPDGIPFGDERFDLIVMLDVLEHLEDDASSLAAISRRLTPGGQLLVTVPARQALWSKHDLLHHHFRRYMGSQVEVLLRGAGLAVEQLSYFNTVLFPLIVVGRLWDRIMDDDRSTALSIPARPLNDLLGRAFALERIALRRRSLPFGASIIAVARAA